MNNNNENNENNEKIERKAGKTILVKSNEPIKTDAFIGLVSSIQTNNGNQFLVFDTIENSQNVYKTLENNDNIKIKFAHYRIFLTITGLDNNIDYDVLKNEHSEWITNNTNTNVLYYKQYKKNTNYLGCGDFTIDTKEGLDKLLNKDELKNFSFGKYSGTFYKYNKKQKNTNENVSNYASI